MLGIEGSPGEPTQWAVNISITTIFIFYTDHGHQMIDLAIPCDGARVNVNESQSLRDPN